MIQYYLAIHWLSNDPKIRDLNDHHDRPHYVKFYAGRRPFCFIAVSSLDLYSPPNLRGRLADRHQTLPHVRW